MIRSLIATSAAMLFVMGGAAGQRESQDSRPGTTANPIAGCATVDAMTPAGQTEASAKLGACVAADDVPKALPSCLVAIPAAPDEAGDAVGAMPPPTPPLVTQATAMSPRVACIYAIFRATDTLPTAFETPPSAGVGPPDTVAPLPDPAPPMIRAPAMLPAGPGVVALPQAGYSKVDFNQPEPPKADLETLPAPRPVRNVPATAVPATAVQEGVVSDAVFAMPAILKTPGKVTLDFDPMVWLSTNQRAPTGISSTGPVGTSFTPGAGDTLGDEHLSRNVVAGARVAIGYWWTEDNPWVPGGNLPTGGIETRFMSVAQRSVGFVDDQSPTLTRPFYDLATGMTSGVVVATPGLATGGLSGTASESLWGLEANVWQTLRRDWPGTTFSVEGMVGLRYLDLNDGIQIGQVSSFVANPVGFPAYASLAGNRIAEQDSFSSQNRFIGGQAGVRGNIIFDTFIFTGQLQLGVGDTNEQINVQGSQVRTLANGQTIVSQGAVLALPGNIGRYTENKLAAVPEMGLKVAVPINGHVTLGMGFTALYWSRIARAGDQVDLTVNSNQIPSFPGAAGAGGVGRTGIPFNQSDMWLMGANFSIQVKW